MNVPVERELCLYLVEDVNIDWLITDSMMCAGSLLGGRDSCYGEGDAWMDRRVSLARHEL